VSVLPVADRRLRPDFLLWVTLALASALAVGSSSADAASGPANGKPIRECLWRGAPLGDSLFVWAKWVPTLAGEPCHAAKGIDLPDSASMGPTYLQYSIEDSRGHVRHMAMISGHTNPGSPEPELYWCCDELSADAAPWRNGIVITLSAAGYGCEPAGDCSYQLFCFLQGADSVAMSEWNQTPWEPASGDSIAGWMGDECCPMR